MTFISALIIVDFQEDFCPPNGSLAVSQGRNIASHVNKLLSLPFVVRVATKDWHPQNHISFASNHDPPNNKPFESIIKIKNPLNEAEDEKIRLWPDHCVQGTKGAELVPELDISRITHIVEKGTDRRVEMYSAFADPFLNPTVSRSNLADLLKDQGVTHCYVVGLAYDYCVKHTALHSVTEGFVTYIVRDATKAVDPSTITDLENDLEKAGVHIIGIHDEEVERLQG